MLPLAVPSAMRRLVASTVSAQLPRMPMLLHAHRNAHAHAHAHEHGHGQGPDAPVVVLMPDMTNPRVQEYFREKMVEQEKHERNDRLGRQVTYYFLMPLIVLSYAYAMKDHCDHIEHMKKHPPKFINYPHIRTPTRSPLFAGGRHTPLQNRAYSFDFSFCDVSMRKS